MIGWFGDPAFLDPSKKFLVIFGYDFEFRGRADHLSLSLVPRAFADFVVIKPSELLARLDAINGKHSLKALGKKWGVQDRSDRISAKI